MIFIFKINIDNDAFDLMANKDKCGANPRQISHLFLLNADKCVKR